MPTLQELIPDANLVLAMAPSDLAPILLRLGRDHVQNGSFWPDTVTQPGIRPDSPRYPFDKVARIDALVSEGWEWLRASGLITPAPGMNGRNGWMVVTSKGETISNDQDFAALKAAVAFPKELLHPDIADKVWLALSRGDLDEAVFFAFKAVEVAVRSASKLAATDIGVSLVRKAFDKSSGPLTNLAEPEAEREALSHLFAGAIGSYKNPHSHRTVNLTDLREAQEQVLLASHLIGIVHARRRFCP
jgi:uncharacterized protein (TIGR02391 family)